MPGVKLDILGNSNSAQAAIDAMLGSLGGLAAKVASAFSAGALVEFTRRAIESADAMEKLAQKTGIAIQQLSGLSAVAQADNISAQELQLAIKALSEWMVRTGQGGRDVNEVLLEQADQFSKMGLGADKTALAIARFGRAGQEMLPFLNRGRDAIAAQLREAEEFGVVIGPEFGAQAVTFNDNLNRMSLIVHGLFLQLADALLPQINALLESMIQLQRQMGFVEAVLRTVLDVIMYLVEGVDVLVTLFNAWTALVDRVAAVLASNFSGALKLAKGLLDLLAEDLGRVVKFIEELMARFASLGSVMKAIATGHIAEAFAIIKDNQKQTAAAFEDLVVGLEGSGVKAVDLISGFSLKTWDSLKSFGGQTIADIEDKWNGFFGRMLSRMAVFAPAAKTLIPKGAPAGGGGASAQMRPELDLAQSQLGIKSIEANPYLSAMEKRPMLMEKLLAQYKAITEAEGMESERARDTNLTIQDREEAQKRLIGLQQQELDVAQKYNELKDQDFLGTMSRGLVQLSDAWGNLGKNVATNVLSAIETAVSGVTEAIMGVIEGTKTWGQVFLQVGRQILATIIQTVVQWIVSMTLIRVLKKIFGSEDKTEAAQSAAAWGPAAIAASIASYGAAAGVGTLAAVGGVAAGSAAIMALAAGLGGMAAGGLVKGGEQIIRVNERGQEFVMNAAAVDQFGANFFANLNAGRPLPEAAAASTAAPAAVKNEQNVHVAVFDNSARLNDWARSNEGKTVILDLVQSNLHQIIGKA